MRSALGIALLLAVASVAVAAAPACNLSLPRQACVAETVTLRSAAAEVDGCGDCVESRCCDPTGACQRIEGCGGEVGATLACVVGGGASRIEEPNCRPLLQSEAAVATYDCIADQCAAECNLPTCRLDPSVPGILNARCDRCFESRCCDVIASCAAERKCKLALECVLTRCEPDIVGAIGQGGDAARALAEIACAAEPPPLGVAPCVQECLDTFAPTRARGGTLEDQRALCEIMRVYACGVGSDCGPLCQQYLEPIARDAGDASGGG
jgi:hypothetical protein